MALAQPALFLNLLLVFESNDNSQERVLEPLESTADFETDKPWPDFETKKPWPWF